jgi:hypothetical protein
MVLTKVFIGGSRHLSRLSPDVKRRLDRIIAQRFEVVVGDANGADKAVQSYLASHGYRSVVVFCMTGACRNNVGDWPTRDVSAPRNARGFAYYAVKDGAMAQEATHGFMLWDGDSKGTLNNILSLVRQDKPVVVYFGPAKAFVKVRSRNDVMQLLGRCEPAAAARFERELDIHRVLQEGAPLI